MKISPQQVAKVAILARLELDEDQTERFTGPINDILDYMEKLGELDTSQIEPLYTPVSHDTVLRKDEVQNEFERDNILENAPESDGQYFIVPKIV